MRVSKSDGYHGHKACTILHECFRQFCLIHRLLWNDCETAKIGQVGDREVPGGVYDVIELGECPMCKVVSQKELAARVLAYYAGQYNV